MKIVSNVRGILCEIVWANYGFAFVCEVGKSCMHCNVLLGTCFYLWQRSPKRGVLGQKVYPLQILSKILQDSSLVVLKKNHQRGKKSSTWGNFDFQKSFYSLFHVSTRADFKKSKKNKNKMSDSTSYFEFPPDWKSCKQCKSHSLN